ncbi:MAG TPA: hypothetical protein PKC76_18635 [Saprospiraceae bacterium]|nr:hypothetical protein [Saprospiraceae bacterium]HMP26152.1 hypothetical protein [Saprospiraceae bacterium]
MKISPFRLIMNGLRALFLSLLLGGCSTDFVLEAEWKDLPVAYGFLSLQDTAHYIRVEKAFLEPGGDATRIARIADSLYYDERTQVQLQRVSNGQTFTLQRVDGALEGYPRAEGVFATTPNILYKIKADDIRLREGETIRLRILRAEPAAPATAETTVLGEINPRETNPPSPMNFGYDRNVVFAWDAPIAARLFDLRLLLHYRESTPGAPGVFTSKTLIWVLNSEILRDNDQTPRVSHTIRGEELYRFLQASLEPVNDRIRILDRVDIQITGVGAELSEFLNIARANAGLTGSQAVPVFTNISGGRGVFSARTAAVRTGLTLNGASLDSLRNGVYTRNLNFQ